MGSSLGLDSAQGLPRPCGPGPGTLPGPNLTASSRAPWGPRLHVGSRAQKFLWTPVLTMLCTVLGRPRLASGQAPEASGQAQETSERPRTQTKAQEQDPVPMGPCQDSGPWGREKTQEKGEKGSRGTGP